MEKLRHLNYVNDETFARNWARSRAQRQGGYGPNRIEQELRAKGIAPTLLREVVSELFADMDETECAGRLIAKRFQGQNLNEPKVRIKAAALLQRRGYSSKAIFDLLRYAIEED